MIKYLLLCLTCCALAASAAFSQTIYLQGRVQDVRPYLHEAVINGVHLYLLRVPEEKFPNGDVWEQQVRLDQYLQQYRAGQGPYTEEFHFHLRAVKYETKGWPWEYWEKEVAAYDAYGAVKKQQWDDSIKAVEKREHDSIFFARQVQGYHFICKPFVLLKEGPGESSMTMGKLYLGSYVIFINPVPGGDFVKIATGGKTGYIHENEMVNSFNRLSATPEQLTEFRSQVYVKYAESPAYRALLQKEEAREAAAQASAPPGGSKPAPARRVYRREANGGCYFIDGQGNKKYVDRGLCN